MIFFTVTYQSKISTDFYHYQRNVCNFHQSLSYAQIVANLTGCDRSSTEELVQCMKGKSQDELVDVTKKVWSYEEIKAGVIC